VLFQVVVSLTQRIVKRRDGQRARIAWAEEHGPQLRRGAVEDRRMAARVEGDDRAVAHHELPGRRAKKHFLQSLDRRLAGTSGEKNERRAGSAGHRVDDDGKDDGLQTRVLRVSAILGHDDRTATHGRGRNSRNGSHAERAVACQLLKARFSAADRLRAADTRAACDERREQCDSRCRGCNLSRPHRSLTALGGARRQREDRAWAEHTPSRSTSDAVRGWCIGRRAYASAPSTIRQCRRALTIVTLRSRRVIGGTIGSPRVITHRRSSQGVTICGRRGL